MLVKNLRWLRIQVLNLGSQTHLRHATHISTEGFSAWYNGHYPLPGFKLLPEQTWRMFVYHEGFSMCSKAGIQFAVPHYSTILNVVSMDCRISSTQAQ